MAVWREQATNLFRFALSFLPGVNMNRNTAKRQSYLYSFGGVPAGAIELPQASPPSPLSQSLDGDNVLLCLFV